MTGVLKSRGGGDTGARRSYGHGRTQVRRWPSTSRRERPRKPPGLPTAPSQAPSLQSGEKYASRVSAALGKAQLPRVLSWARSPCPRPAAAAHRPLRSVCLLSGFLPAPAPSPTGWLAPSRGVIIATGTGGSPPLFQTAGPAQPREALSSLAPPTPTPGADAIMSSRLAEGKEVAHSHWQRQRERGWPG